MNIYFKILQSNQGYLAVINEASLTTTVNLKRSVFYVNIEKKFVYQVFETDNKSLKKVYNVNYYLDYFIWHYENETNLEYVNEDIFHKEKSFAVNNYQNGATIELPTLLCFSNYNSICNYIYSSYRNNS